MEINKIQSILDGANQPVVMMLVGPPLSGKDTMIRQLNLNDTVVISRDQIVLDLWGTDDYDAAFKGVDQKKVDKELLSLMKESAMNHKNVIINMTNLTSKRRKSTLDLFDNSYYKVAVIFPILDSEEYVSRNEKRFKEEKKFIPTNVLKNMISSYNPISKEEGFHKIISL